MNCRATVGCIVQCGKNLVMVYEQQDGNGAWDIPAGGIEPNETPEQAIIRELQEEIGLKVAGSLMLAKIFWAQLDNSPVVHFLYQYHIDATVVQTLRPKTLDIEKIGIFTAAEVQDLINSKAYEHALAKERLQFFLSDSPTQSAIYLV